MRRLQRTGNHHPPIRNLCYRNIISRDFGNPIPEYGHYKTLSFVSSPSWQLLALSSNQKLIKSSACLQVFEVFYKPSCGCSELPYIWNSTMRDSIYSSSQKYESLSHGRRAA